MTKKDQEDIAQLTLQHLKYLRDASDKMSHDISDIKFRLHGLERTTLHHTTMFDRIDERLSHIEKRLALVDA